MEGIIAIGSAVAPVMKDERGWFAAFENDADWIAAMKNLAALDIALKQYSIVPTYEVGCNEEHIWGYYVRLPEEAAQYITPA